MAAVRHVGFVKFKFFKGQRGLESHFVPNFVKIGQTVAGIYIAIFVIFKMAAAAILDFQKIQNFNRGAIVRQHAKFHQNRSNGCRYMAI